jgi:hypothetical protein
VGTILSVRTLRGWQSNASGDFGDDQNSRRRLEQFEAKLKLDHDLRHGIEAEIPKVMRIMANLFVVSYLNEKGLPS